ncbi:MAG: hypothetical protein ACK5MT_11875 [Actinomycetales bacterium]
MNRARVENGKLVAGEHYYLIKNIQAIKLESALELRWRWTSTFMQGITNRHKILVGIPALGTLNLVGWISIFAFWSNFFPEVRYAGSSITASLILTAFSTVASLQLFRRILYSKNFGLWVLQGDGWRRAFFSKDRRFVQRIKHEILDEADRQSHVIQNVTNNIFTNVKGVSIGNNNKITNNFD